MIVTRQTYQTNNTIQYYPVNKYLNSWKSGCSRKNKNTTLHFIDTTYVGGSFKKKYGWVWETFFKFQEKKEIL